jgi:molecular chaperone GrpE
MEEATTPVETQAAGPETVSGGSPAIDPVLAERDKLASEKTELNDLLLRRTAECDNLRRRAEREKMEIREYAAMDATLALLPILDDFERALKAAPVNDDYTKGMELIQQRFLDTLRKLGLEPIEAVGKPFDPKLHNAIQREERRDVDDQTILEEYQGGFNFKGRLLRPAMVKVAVR